MKKISFLAAGILMAVALAACSGKDTQSSQAGSAQSIGTEASTDTSTDVSVSEGTNASTKTTDDARAGTLYELIAKDITLPDMSALSEKYLLNTYGIETELCSSYVFYRASDVADGTTIAIFYVKNEADAAVIAGELEKAKAFDTESANGYNQETYEQFTHSTISQSGNLVYWIVADASTDIEKLIIDNQ